MLSRKVSCGYSASRHVADVTATSGGHCSRCFLRYTLPVPVINRLPLTLFFTSTDGGPAFREFSFGGSLYLALDDPHTRQVAGFSCLLALGGNASLVRIDSVSEFYQLSEWLTNLDSNRSGSYWIDGEMGSLSEGQLQYLQSTVWSGCVPGK